MKKQNCKLKVKIFRENLDEKKYIIVYRNVN